MANDEARMTKEIRISKKLKAGKLKLTAMNAEIAEKG
jgi:hypothetical protein